MKILILSRRHSETNGICDVCKKYGGAKTLTAQVRLVSWNSGDALTGNPQMGICRKCARAILGAATNTGGKK